MVGRPHAFPIAGSRRLALRERDSWLRCRGCGSPSDENLTRGVIDPVQLAAGVVGVDTLALCQPLGEIAQQADDLLRMQVASVRSLVHHESVSA